MRRAAIALLSAVAVVVLVGLLWDAPPTNTPRTADLQPSGDLREREEPSEDLARNMLNLEELSPHDALPQLESAATPAPVGAAPTTRARGIVAPAPPAVSGTFDDAIPGPDLPGSIGLGAASS